MQNHSFSILETGKVVSIKFPNLIDKYGQTCDIHNFRYLTNNLVVFEVNLELILVQLIGIDPG